MVREKRLRSVVGDAARWKALSHPVRGAILEHLNERGPSTSTTLAEALGESTGTTSYHLRVLAEPGIIEEVPERARGRERWWRTVPTDHREPDYDTLSAADKEAVDTWRAQQIPGERALFERFLADYRAHGRWARAARVRTHITEDGLQAIMDGLMDLVDEHGHEREDAPPGARPVSLRMFHLPDGPPPS